MVYSKESFDTQKKLIGEFVIYFEDINDWLTFLIPKIIFKNENTVHKNNIDCLTSELTTNPLKSKFDSILADNFKHLKKLIELNKKLSTKVSKFQEIRNTIVHSSYRLGWKNFDGELSLDTFSIKKGKSTKDGFEKRAMIISTEKLKEYNLELREISRCYNIIAAIIDTDLREINNMKEIYTNDLDVTLNTIKVSKLEYIDIKNN